ncbi:MAG: hypothetical protein RBU30_16320 [Polyangia bacterium]|nr:hypothetical protein [Polyangia bacterium]
MTRRIALVVACLMIAMPAGCKKKKAEEGSGDTQTAMEAMEGEGMEAMEGEGMEAMDAMEGGDAMEGKEPGAGSFPELDKLLEKQKAMGKIMEGIKTLADLEKRKPDYLALSVEVLDLTIGSLREAVKMDKDKLKGYLAKAAQMNKANADFGKKMAEMQAEIMKIDGAKEFLDKLQKETAEKLKDKTEELMKLMQELGKRQAELQ